jgi:hypothetical protein
VAGTSWQNIKGYNVWIFEDFQEDNLMWACIPYCVLASGCSFVAKYHGTNITFGRMEKSLLVRWQAQTVHGLQQSSPLRQQ